jgi:hypothetical protein
MKKLFIAILVLALSACVPAAPAAQQPVIINVTVVAPAAPAAVDAPTAVPPAATDAPTAVPPTDVPTAVPAAPTDVPTAVPPAATAAPEATATNAGQAAVGAAILTDITRSGDAFALKCAPSEITFSVKSANNYITGVQFYYRMVDKINSMSSSWYPSRNLDSVGNGVYTITFSALDINPDVRFDHGWFEYQFVGLSKSGNAVGRTDKFEKQVSFSKECP